MSGKWLHFILMITLACVVGQPSAKYSSTNKKALAHYDKAQMMLSRKMFAEAIPELEEAIKKDNKFVEAYVTLGTVHKMLKSYSAAKEYLIKAIELQPNNEGMYGPYFAIGEMSLKQGDYENAEKYMNGFLKFKSAPAPQKVHAQKVLETCLFAKESMRNPLKFNAKPLEQPLNQFAAQYFPTVTADGRTMVFTAIRTSSRMDDENLYVTQLGESGWSVPVPLSSNINTNNNEGTASISGDGKTLVFTACGRRDSKGGCDLYISYKVGNEWTIPVNMGTTINSNEWDSQPSLSADGRKLYFISSRRGGFGREDIYVSTRDDEGSWTPPINLGEKINTSESDVSPFIHANGKTLYFSSNGRIGMGGQDLFYTNLSDTGWTEPVNLGYPINTPKDEMGLVVSSDMRKAYFSVDKSSKDNLSSKLYEFEYPEELRNIAHVVVAKGTIVDMANNKPLGAVIELIDITKKEKVAKVESDKLNGTFTLVLTEGSEYALHVSADGYLFKSLSFNFTNAKEFDPMTLDLKMEKAEAGSHIVLNNIFFESGKYQLQEKSYSELEKVRHFLFQNPKLKVEISGHTDNVGKYEDNRKLSELRAKSVVNYLVEKGIDASRLKYVGYADKEPIADNDTEENRQLNRRIEFKIL